MAILVVSPRNPERTKTMTTFAIEFNASNEFGFNANSVWGWSREEALEVCKSLPATAGHAWEPMYLGPEAGGYAVSLVNLHAKAMAF